MFNMNKKNLLSPFSTNKTNNQEKNEIGEDFQKLINEKVGKIDEILIAIQSKQDEMQVKFDKPIDIPSGVATGAATGIADVRMGVEPKKKKRSYYNITDSMWKQVADNFPELCEKKFKSKVMSDGESFYVNLNKTKKLLDNKLYLKLLNDKTIS